MTNHNGKLFVIIVTLTSGKAFEYESNALPIKGHHLERRDPDTNAYVTYTIASVVEEIETNTTNKQTTFRILAYPQD